MAVKSEVKSTVLTLKLQKDSETDSGKMQKIRFNQIATTATDSALHAAGKALGALQTNPVAEIMRTAEYVLTEE